MKNDVLDQALFDTAVNAMPQDDLSGIRRTAAAQFSRTGFPTLRDEDWRYTDISSAIALSNRWFATNSNSTSGFIAADANILTSIDAHWIVIRNGIIDLEKASLPASVSIERLSVSTNNETSETPAMAIDDAMTQLNAALLIDGLSISVASGITLVKPIGFLIVDDSADSARVVQTRIIINMQPQSAAKFIEAHASAGSNQAYANSVVQLDLAKHSNVDYLRVQQRDRQHFQTGKLTACIADDAELRHSAFDLGGSLIRNELIVRLEGRNASVQLSGLYLAGNLQHIDNHTRVDHLVGPSRSTEEYRGILNRKSRCVFNGKAIVHKGADGTDAQQSNHNLLLSGDAEIDTKPELEIYADDVKCAHGATVGQLDEAALFYLRSRGLDKNTATQLLTRAFASEVLNMMTIPEAAEYLSAALDERLDTLTGADQDA